MMQEAKASLCIILEAFPNQSWVPKKQHSYSENELAFVKPRHSWSGWLC